MKRLITLIACLFAGYWQGVPGKPGALISMVGTVSVNQTQLDYLRHRAWLQGWAEARAQSDPALDSQLVKADLSSIDAASRSKFETTLAYDLGLDGFTVSWMSTASGVSFTAKPKL